jgi:GTP-binding protein HflX
LAGFRLSSQEAPMIERPAAGERAVIVQLDFGQPDLDDQLEEVRLLAESAGGLVVAEVFGRRQSPDPKPMLEKVRSKRSG